MPEFAKKQKTNLKMFGNDKTIKIIFIENLVSF